METKTLEEALEPCTDYEKILTAFTGLLKKRYSCEANSNLVKTRDQFEHEIRGQLEKIYKNLHPYTNLTIDQKNALITQYGMELDKQHGYGQFIVYPPTKKDPFCRIMSWETFREKYYNKYLSKNLEKVGASTSSS